MVFNRWLPIIYLIKRVMEIDRIIGVFGIYCVQRENY